MKFEVERHPSNTHFIYENFYKMSYCSNIESDVFKVTASIVFDKKLQNIWLLTKVETNKINFRQNLPKRVSRFTKGSKSIEKKTKKTRKSPKVSRNLRKLLKMVLNRIKKDQTIGKKL